MDVLERYEPIVDDFDAFLEACERPLPTTVRVNRLKTTVERTVEALESLGVGVERRSWNDRLLELDLETDKPGNTWPYFHGWFHVQEEVSAIPAFVLDPEPGQTVFDACAAPGSKTTQLADLMDDRGLLVANDANLGRLSALRGNADRLGVTCAAVTNQDARQFEFERFGRDAFDAALLDVPCSGEGTVRKNPDALQEAGRETSESMAGLQRHILRRAVNLTKPGGTVVYSTCTFAPEENEGVVDAVLDDCRLVDYDIGLDHDDGLTEWNDAEYDESMTKAKRFYPHQNDAGGFFTAKLEVRA
ncbi:RsmB/NOP family class I SAM-dependent RNA methyltransferase [Halospeciosus flavus]|uniref:RsmB/NOP family class I SAM-dependent RNA methyltransferase n=1 Tax=Halospeciosus flavus TaxID=3032283 RepID=A0ABD5Z4L3_9EURY|nr:RsmB/NOP family class I SAM-dependent RNA methyltransferase [Halospeciosus flavus]